MTSYIFSGICVLLTLFSTVLIRSELQFFALVLCLLIFILTGLAFMFDNVSAQKIILSLAAGLIVTVLWAALWYYGGNVANTSLYFTAMPFLCQLVVIVLDLVTPQTQEANTQPDQTTPNKTDN